LSGVVKSSIKRVLTLLPLSVRCCLDVVSVSVVDVVQLWRLPVYRVKAIVPGSDVEASVTYVGNCPQYPAWTYALFGRHIEPELVTDITMLQVMFGGGQGDDDFFVYPSNRVTAPFFSIIGWYSVPRFINCRIDLNNSLSNIFSGGGAKKEIKVVENKNYTFDMLSVDGSFEEFYYEMLLPTISVRHKERAVISSFEVLREVMNHGFLLGVFSEGKWLGACMLVRESSTVLRFANGGYRAGDSELLKNSILSALQIEMVTFAKKNGFRWLDNGVCNSFPTDGSLHYKMKWGAGYSAPKIEYDGESLSGVRNLFSLKVDLQRPGSRALLNRTPVFDVNAGKLRVIGWNSVVHPVFRKAVKAGFEWVNLDSNRAGDENLTAHEKPLS